MGAADAPRHIELFLYDAVPDPPAGGKHLGIPCQSGRVRHAAVEIHCPHRVAHRLRLLPHRHMGLMIMEALFLPGFPIGSVFICRPFLLLQIKVIGPAAPHIQKETCKLQIFLLSRQLIESGQGHLRDLMTGIPLFLPLLRPELAADKIRIPLYGLQQLVFPRGLIIRDRALRQMSEAVQLMVIPQIGEDPIHAVDDIIGVQIAVVRLSGAYDIDGAVCDLLQLRIRMIDQGIPHRLDPLGKIAVLKYEAVELVRIGIFRILRQRLKAPEGVGRRLKGGSLLPLLAHHAACHPEIPHTIAGRRIRHLIV